MTTLLLADIHGGKLGDGTAKALAAATGGDLAPVTRLVRAVSQPYVERADLADLAGPAPDDAGPYITYCGT